MELKNKEYYLIATEFDGIESDYIKFTQNDTNNSVLNISVPYPSGQLLLCVTKPDGNDVVDRFVASDETNTNFNMELPINLINLPGTYKATVQAYGHDDDRRTVGTFKYRIASDFNTDFIESNENYPVLTKLISDVNSLYDKVVDIDHGEGGRILAEEQRVQAEIVRKGNEVIRENQEIAREERLKEVESSLESKTDKGNVSVADINKNLGKFDQTYMTDEFLQQISGDTPINTTPADKSITLEKLAFKTIDCIVGSNLFDKYDIITSRYVGADGSLVFNGKYTTSNSILVEIGEKYIHNGKMFSGGIYDISGNFISQINSNPFTIPVNGASVKISMLNENIATLKLEKGEVSTNYKNHIVVAPESIEEIRKDMLVDEMQIETFMSKNLFDKTKIKTDKYISPTGGIFNSVGYYVGDYIPVKQGVTYCVSKLWNYGLYDFNKTFILLKDTQTFTATQNGFVRIVGKIVDLDLQQLEVGTSPTNYQEFGKTYVDGNYVVNLNQVNSEGKTIITVEKSGGNFNSISSALDSITDASPSNRYEIRVGLGTFTDTFRTKHYVDIIGKDKYKTIITFTGDVATWVDTSTIFAESECKLANFTVEGTDTKYPMHIDKATGQWTCILENVRMIHRGSNTSTTHAGTPIGIGLYQYQHLIIKNCEMIYEDIKGTQAFGASGVYFHNQYNSSGTGYRSIRIEECNIKGVTYGIRPNDIDGSDMLQNNDAYIINNNIRATHQEYYYPENSPTWNLFKKGNEYTQG